MDGYLNPIRDELSNMRARLVALEGMFTDAQWEAAEKKQADALKDAPQGVTVHPARLPAEPGLPIAPYDPETQGPDEATDKAIAAEVKAREDRRLGRKPDDKDKAKLDDKSKAKLDDPDTMQPMKVTNGPKART